MARDPSGLLQSDVRARGVDAAHAVDCVEHQVLHLVPDPGRVEVVAGAVDRGDRHRGGGHRRRQPSVEADPLQRVVLGPDRVEQASEPTGPRVRAELADLVVMPRGEVRLVGAAVPDRRDHRDLALAMQGVERRRRGMPAKAPVLGEAAAVARAELQRRPPGLVVGVVDRSENRERVDPALEEDVDDHRAGAPLGACDSSLELREPELRRAVDREQRRARAGQEGAPVHARPGGRRHPALDLGQAAARLRRRAAQHPGPAVLAAVSPSAGHQVGGVAISIRSAFWRRARK